MVGLRAKVLGRLGRTENSPSKSVCSILPIARRFRAGVSWAFHPALRFAPPRCRRACLMYPRAASLQSLYIRNIIPDDMGILLLEHLALSGWGYADFHAGENFALKLSEKGYEQRSERGFGLYIGAQTCRTLPLRCPGRPRLTHLRDFSDSFKALDFSHSRCVANCVGQSFHEGPWDFYRLGR